MPIPTGKAAYDKNESTKESIQKMLQLLEYQLPKIMPDLQNTSHLSDVEYLQRFEKLYFMYRICANEISYQLKYNGFNDLSRLLDSLKNMTIKLFDKMVDYLAKQGYKLEQLRSNQSTKIVYVNSEDFSIFKEGSVSGGLNTHQAEVSVRKEILTDDPNKKRYKMKRHKGVFDLGDEIEILERQNKEKEIFERKVKKLIDHVLINDHQVFKDEKDLKVIVETKNRIYDMMIDESKNNIRSCQEYMLHLTEAQTEDADELQNLEQFQRDIATKVENINKKKLIQNNWEENISIKSLDNVKKQLLATFEGHARNIALKVLQFIEKTKPHLQNSCSQTDKIKMKKAESKAVSEKTISPAMELLSAHKNNKILLESVNQLKDALQKEKTAKNLINDERSKLFSQNMNLDHHNKSLTQQLQIVQSELDRIRGYEDEVVSLKSKMGYLENENKKRSTTIKGLKDENHRLGDIYRGQAQKLSVMAESEYAHDDQDRENRRRKSRDNRSKNSGSSRTSSRRNSRKKSARSRRASRKSQNFNTESKRNIEMNSIANSPYRFETNYERSQSHRVTRNRQRFNRKKQNKDSADNSKEGLKNDVYEGQLSRKDYAQMNSNLPNVVVTNDQNEMIIDNSSPTLSNMLNHTYQILAQNQESKQEFYSPQVRPGGVKTSLFHPNIGSNILIEDKGSFQKSINPKADLSIFSEKIIDQGYGLYHVIFKPSKIKVIKAKMAGVKIDPIGNFDENDAIKILSSIEMNQTMQNKKGGKIKSLKVSRRGSVRRRTSVALRHGRQLSLINQNNSSKVKIDQVRIPQRNENGLERGSLDSLGRQTPDYSKTRDNYYKNIQRGPSWQKLESRPRKTSHDRNECNNCDRCQKKWNSGNGNDTNSGLNQTEPFSRKYHEPRISVIEEIDNLSLQNNHQKSTGIKKESKRSFLKKISENNIEKMMTINKNFHEQITNSETGNGRISNRMTIKDKNGKNQRTKFNSSENMNSELNSSHAQFDYDTYHNNDSQLYNISENQFPQDQEIDYLEFDEKKYRPRQYKNEKLKQIQPKHLIMDGLMVPKNKNKSTFNTNLPHLQKYEPEQVLEYVRKGSRQKFRTKGLNNQSSTRISHRRTQSNQIIVDSNQKNIVDSIVSHPIQIKNRQEKNKRELSRQIIENRIFENLAKYYESKDDSLHHSINILHTRSLNYHRVLVDTLYKICSQVLKEHPRRNKFIEMVENYISGHQDTCGVHCIHLDQFYSNFGIFDHPTIQGL